MSEELIQRNLLKAPEKMGQWDYYNIGATTLKALKAVKIIPDRDYDTFEKKKPDALIIKKPQVIAAIEYKQPKSLKTKRQIEIAIKQELGTAKELGAKVYIITDGKKTFWINPQTGNDIKLEDGSTVSLTFNKDDVECIKLISKAYASLTDKNDTVLTAAVVDPLPLAQKVWQDLWAVSGATPENCLYTFVEVFIFKYLSDLGVLTGLHSFNNLILQYRSNTENEVLEYYASTIRVKIKTLFPRNPKDNTTIINGTIFVSKDDKAVAGYATVFKKILERFRDFGTLENIDYDFKSKLFETFLKESISKKNWGQFFTPLKVVRAIMRMADIRPGMKVCDPACGVGKFLLEPILHDIHKYYKVENGELKPQITLCGFDKGFDKDEQKTIILAKANMLIYLSSLIREYPSLTEQFAKQFNNTFLLQTNSILGTLAMPTVDEYDLILTNPPYVMSGSSNLKDEISKKTPEEVAAKQKSTLEQYFSVSAMGVEGLFTEWIVRAMKPGGKAFVVVPDGIMNRSNDKRLREFILEECEIDAVISLPLNTFFTTNKKTYIMALTKKVATMVDGVSTKPRQNTPVFTYICSEIGESRDIYRFDIEQNDLDNAATLYNMFKGVRGDLPVEDKRCKFVSIDEFYNGSHWSIERWWTREEKIELGIEDEKDIITIEEFISLISDTALSISEFEEPLRELVKKKSELEYKELPLSQIFNFSITTNKSSFTKSFINQNKGEIPVFGATKSVDDVSYGFIKDNIKGVKYFSDCLTWNIDGSLGIFHRKGRFSLSEKVIPLVVCEKYSNALDLDYLKAAIWEAIKVNPFSYTNKGGKGRLMEIIVKIPIGVDGEFDLKSQKLLAELYNEIDQERAEFEYKKSTIEKANVVIDDSAYKVKMFKVSELFVVLRGSGKYTKNYTKDHQGPYPVYSGNTTSEFAYIDSFDYSTPCLSWVIDGLAGYLMTHCKPFSATNHRGILIPKVENIDLTYAKYVLEPIFRDAKKGRLGDNGQNEYTSLPPFMIEDLQIPFPIDSEGNFCIHTQLEIANKYLMLESCKNDVALKLEKVVSQKVTF